MNGPTDQQLLLEYVASRADAAFAELVQRRVDPVYSTALRMVRDSHLAEDVAQSVFIALSLGVSEEAAQKRVNRAVERLRVGRPLAECNSAIRQIENLRYCSSSRWQNICAGSKTAKLPRSTESFAGLDTKFPRFGSRHSQFSEAQRIVSFGQADTL